MRYDNIIIHILYDENNDYARRPIFHSIVLAPITVFGTAIIRLVEIVTPVAIDVAYQATKALYVTAKYLAEKSR